MAFWKKLKQRLLTASEPKLYLSTVTLRLENIPKLVKPEIHTYEDSSQS